MVEATIHITSSYVREVSSSLAFPHLLDIYLWLGNIKGRKEAFYHVSPFHAIGNGTVLGFCSKAELGCLIWVLEVQENGIQFPSSASQN